LVSLIRIVFICSFISHGVNKPQSWANS